MGEELRSINLDHTYAGRNPGLQPNGPLQDHTYAHARPQSPSHGIRLQNVEHDYARPAQDRPVEDWLPEIYYNAGVEGSFSSANKLYAEMKRRNLKISLGQIKKWLAEQETFTKHKRIVRKFRRNRILLRGMWDLFQMDLTDMQKFSARNDRVKYLLGIIDCFSKFAWVYPLKSKSTQSMRSAFIKFFQTIRPNKPKNLQSDKGSEFINKEMQQFFQSEQINFYTTKNDMPKAAIIERFWRTLKGKIFKYMTANKTKRYIDILPTLVNTYNNTKHRSIKMRPSEVNKENETQVLETLFPEQNRTLKVHYQIGDKVRIVKKYQKFERGFTTNFSNEVFIVNSILPRSPPVYSLTTLQGEKVDRTWYAQELVLVL